MTAYMNMIRKLSPLRLRLRTGSSSNQHTTTFAFGNKVSVFDGRQRSRDIFFKLKMNEDQVGVREQGLKYTFPLR